MQRQKWGEGLASNQLESPVASEADLERKTLYRQVEYGRLSRVEADDRLRELGLPPFESRPDLSNFDAMKEEEWTLPMAAAWFIWRSADAVRDQWNPARERWRKWVQLKRVKISALRPRGPRFKLKKFGRATLADVFSQVGLPAVLHMGTATVRKNVASDHIHTPYSRLKETLQSGSLRATWGKRGGDDFEEILPEYWRVRFEAVANPKKQPSSDPPDPAPVLSTAWTLISRKSEIEPRRAVKLSPPNAPTINPNELEDLPDLSLTETSTSQVPQGRRHDAVPQDENNRVFLRREDVILAEQKVSQIEYEQPDWSLGQALGWVAYRRREAFRSLWETDLNPRPVYYGEAYSSGLVTDDPASALREALMSERLIGRVGGESLSPAKWLDLDVWGVRRIKFLRADVIRVWGELPAPPSSKRPPPSDDELTNIHAELDRALGKISTYQEFYDKLKELGIAPAAESVKVFHGEYLDKKGINRQRGRRTYK